MRYGDHSLDDNIYKDTFTKPSYSTSKELVNSDNQITKRVHGNLEYISLKNDIAELRELILEEQIKNVISHSNQNSSSLLKVRKQYYKPTQIVKIRIISLSLSSVLAGILIAYGISILSNWFIEGLFFASLAIPPIGITIASIITLFKGEKYDY